MKTSYVPNGYVCIYRALGHNTANLYVNWESESCLGRPDDYVHHGHVRISPFLSFPVLTRSDSEYEESAYAYTSGFLPRKKFVKWEGGEESLFRSLRHRFFTDVSVDVMDDVGLSGMMSAVGTEKAFYLEEQITNEIHDRLIRAGVPAAWASRDREVQIAFMLSRKIAYYDSKKVA